MKNLTFIALIFWGSTAFTQNTQLVNLPQTVPQSGKKYIEAFLKVVNAGNPKRSKTFVEQNFAANFLNAFPVRAHLEYLRNAHNIFGNLTFHKILGKEKRNTSIRIEAAVKTTRTELWQTVRLDITNKQPYKIASLRIYDMDCPVKQKPLTLKEAVKALDGYVQRMAKRDAFSGTVLLALDDKVLYKSAKGLASKRFNVSNNVQTKFNLGSMNKMFTAIGVLQLVEAGKLSLTDKLSKFVDESWLPKKITDKIEIQHLLTHTSGLGSYFNRTYRRASKNNFRALSDYKPLIKNETLRFEPGSRWRYSNTGLFLAGVVIEKVSGQTYFDYIREHIYKPAGMINSDCYEMDQPVPNLAIGYDHTPNNSTGWRNNLYSHVLKGGPAGGGFSTVEDLYRFARALTNYKLLSKKLTEAAYSPKPKLNSPTYGYGFGIRSGGKNRIVGHSGGFTGINSNLSIFLDKGYVMAVMSNYSQGARPIQTKIRELLGRVK